MVPVQYSSRCMASDVRGTMVPVHVVWSSRRHFFIDKMPHFIIRSSVGWSVDRIDGWGTLRKGAHDTHMIMPPFLTYSDIRSTSTGSRKKSE